MIPNKSSKPLSTALADTILIRFPDPDSIPYRRWCYVQGYVLAGFEKLWQITRDPRYFDYIRKFVDQHVTEAGDLRDFTGESLDDMMAGTIVVTLYQHTGQEKYRLAANKIYQSFKDYPRNKDGGFWHGRLLPHEMWIDGVFMGGMFLTRYGAVIGEQKACFNEVAHQIITFASHCRKGSSGLYLHAYDESKSVFWADPVTGLSSDVWSEGLGWFALILVETLGLMPPDHPKRAEVLQIFLDLLAGLHQAQDFQTGRWYQVVDKGDQPDNWQDTSGSAMFVYAFQRAIDLGIIDPVIYAPVVQKGYAGLLAKAVVNEAGLVDILEACDGVCVQRSYEDYIHYPKAVNAKEAVGGVLWAATVVEKP